MLFMTNSYDIIAVTETWLTDNISDSELLEYGYTIYRRDRQVKIEVWSTVGREIQHQFKSSFRPRRLRLGDCLH